MLASELITKLQEAIERHSDLPVFSEADWDWVGYIHHREQQGPPQEYLQLEGYGNPGPEADKATWFCKRDEEQEPLYLEQVARMREQERRRFRK